MQLLPYVLAQGKCFAFILGTYHYKSLSSINEQLYDVTLLNILKAFEKLNYFLKLFLMRTNSFTCHLKIILRKETLL